MFRVTALDVFVIVVILQAPTGVRGCHVPVIAIFTSPSGAFSNSTWQVFVDVLLIVPTIGSDPT